MPALRIKYPQAGEITHVLRDDRVTVGRAADNTIQIPHASISSHHAELVATKGGYHLRDLCSTNRSYVEGQPVSEHTLEGACKILFGSVECEYDPHATTTVRTPPALPAPATVPTFLESENRELRAHVHSLQRRFDILGTSRLLGSRADQTPVAAATHEMKSLAGERDDLRQENAALRLQIERLNAELSTITRERDAARHAAESLQADRAALHRDLRNACVEQPADLTPPRPPAVALPPADLQLVPQQLRALRDAITTLAAAPADRALLTRAEALAAPVVHHAGAFGAHPFPRVARSLRDLLTHLAAQPAAPAATILRTARQAAEFLERLLDPALNSVAASLDSARILVVEDDAALLSAIAAALSAAGLDITTAASAEEAITAIAAAKFDTILADVGLPGITGTAFCAHAREQPAYRRTPILFLTGANTVDTRAATSLSGGSEFMAKPFNTHELVLKVELWALKHQLQLG
jgi:CheY-like chemotaxis protein